MISKNLLSPKYLGGLRENAGDFDALGCHPEDGAGGQGQLYIDGELVGAAEVPVTTPISLGLTSGVRVGSAPGAPVGPEIVPPFEYGGKIHSVTVDVSGDLIEDDEATLRMLMARQ